MGIKAFKEHFGGGYIVQRVRDGRIAIGSAYAHDLIIIMPDLSIKKSKIVREDGEAGAVFHALVEAAESGRLKNTLDSQDVFGELHDVFLVENGTIVKKQCEEFGWPNITTDGEMLYDNASFKTRREALRHLRGETLSGVRMTFRSLVDAICDTLWDRIKRFALRSFYAFRAWALFGY